ncbi:MAG: hypothetical protein UW74_C0042G0002 [Candidatus Giovannonibacteria bacterium GW2011_GWC2_44_8]|uniref:Rod shape-determining protein MreC beta-barrel core domain-containing protein n=2 Tax=Candidatus Giovannoniibacteriota TaxID=1752738 RepID=A0A1F5Y593_9BACT|nr:MAG: hypothetical protein UW74_C0042G0002 [Candidatus Giovannonibacteria bacterium GW2011_GWC2_44_8]OGF95239.1 MAG: hypothetical protein A2Y47_02980 [Candidatus Giovannonibacteria bacterium RIFCSPLOWO2_12_43_8]
MKTNSRQRNSFLYKAAAGLILAIILLAGLGIVSVSFRSGVRDFFDAILSFSAAIRNSLIDFGGNRILELESRNAELLGENSALKEKISGLESGEGNSRNDRDIIKSSALILSQAPSTPYDTLLISMDALGVAKFGTRVVAHKEIYIGDISEIGARSAMVKLLSYPAAENEAWLMQAGINITLVGEGGYNMKFSVPKSISVEVGDKVLSNTSPQFLIGEVEQIIEKPTNPLKEIRLRFPFNFRNLRYVELID